MTKPHKITELFAWIVTHPNGEEGVPALDGGRLSNPAFAGMALPMVGSDAERITSLRPYAVSIAASMGMPVKLCKFSECTVLEDFQPPRKAGSA